MRWWKKKEEKKKRSIYAWCFNYDSLNVQMRRELFFFQHIFVFECDENYFSFNTFLFSNATRIIFLLTHLRFRMRRESPFLQHIFVFECDENLVFRIKIIKSTYKNETRIILQIQSSTQQWQISRFSNWIDIMWDVQRRTNSLVDALKKKKTMNNDSNIWKKVY